MKEYLSWVATFLRFPIFERKELVKRTLKQLVEEGSGTGSFEKRKEQGKILCDLIKGSDWKIIGAMASIRYMKIDAPKEDLGALHVHPFGSAGLLYYNKRLGTMVIVGAGLRFDDSVVNEFKENVKINTAGITGP